MLNLISDIGGNMNALATISGAIIGACVGVITGVVSLKREKRNFYSSTVSHERVVWLTVTRELTAELLAFCAIHKQNDLTEEEEFTFEKLRNALLLRITPKTYANRQLYKNDSILIEILESDFLVLRERAAELREIVALICKDEWNRIKAEAGGNRNLEALIKKYDKSIHNMPVEEQGKNRWERNKRERR